MYRRTGWVTFALLCLILAPNCLWGQVSRIEFDRSGKYRINYAPVSAKPEFKGCPIEAGPVSIAQTAQQVVNSIQSKITEIQQADRYQTCTSLVNRLNSSRSQLNNVLTSQIKNDLSGTSDVSSQKMAQASQQANVLGEVIGVGTDLLENECSLHEDSRVLTQKLVGQAMTLGGLVTGGWGGLFAAVGGQTLARIPFFKSDAVRANEAMRQYKYSAGVSGFLCLYREMLLGTTLIFAPVDTRVIQGFDLDGVTGFTKEILENHQVLEADAKLHTEIQFLSLVSEQGPQIGTSIQKLTDVCPAIQTGTPVAFTDTSLYPLIIQDSYLKLFNFCSDLAALKFQPASEDGATLGALTSAIRIVSLYNKNVRPPVVTEALDNHVLYKNFVSTRQKYLDILTGEAASNQLRINILQLNEELGETVAKNSFERMIQDNMDTIQKASHSHDIRRRAYFAMLDACKTFDPSLSPLYPEFNKKPKFLESWEKTCVGMDSVICKTSSVLLLREQPNYQAYRKSLCGK